MKKRTLSMFSFALVLLFASTSAAVAFAQEPAQPSPQTLPQDQSAPPAQAAPAYTPKYRTDPAHSESEFNALAYMRGVMRAEVAFHKHYGHYATSLTQLVHSGNFTQRMVDPHRGDYTVGYRQKNDNYMLTMTPNALDAQHRSFYADDDGKIHADESKAADADSQVIETHHF